MENNKTCSNCDKNISDSNDDDNNLMIQVATSAASVWPNIPSVRYSSPLAVTVALSHVILDIKGIWHQRIINYVGIQRRYFVILLVTDELGRLPAKESTSAL